MIRFATTKDIPDLLAMGRKFFDCSGYSETGDYNPEVTTELLNILISNNWCLITEGGMIGWIVTPMYMTGVLQASELFWWVDEDKRSTGLGLELIQVAEDTARLQGAKYMTMVYIDDLNGERMGILYNKLGYKQKEHTCVREL